MVRVEGSFEHELQPWVNATDEDEIMKLWVVNQLMGETEKGDTFEYGFIKETGIELFAGVLRGMDGSIKALVPAVFNRKHDGVWTQHFYNGEIIEVDADVDADWRRINSSEDIDEAVREWVLG